MSPMPNVTYAECHIKALLLIVNMLNVVILSVVALFENVIGIQECSYQQPSLPYRIEVTPKDIFIDLL
jgi:hypothetical protein